MYNTMSMKTCWYKVKHAHLCLCFFS